MSDSLVEKLASSVKNIPNPASQDEGRLCPSRLLLSSNVVALGNPFSSPRSLPTWCTRSSVSGIQPARPLMRSVTICERGTCGQRAMLILTLDSPAGCYARWSRGGVEEVRQDECHGLSEICVEGCLHDGTMIVDFSVRDTLSHACMCKHVNSRVWDVFCVHTSVGYSGSHRH